MSLAVLGPQAPTNHALGCPLVARSLVVLGAKVSTSFGRMVPGFSLISSSSRYLAHLSATGKWFLESPGSKGPVAPIDQSKLEPKVNKATAEAKPACAQVATSALVPWSLWHQAGNDALVPRFLGLTFSREQGTVAAGCPRSPWKLGPLVPGPATTQVSSPTWSTWSLDRNRELDHWESVSVRARLRPSQL